MTLDHSNLILELLLSVMSYASMSRKVEIDTYYKLVWYILQACFVNVRTILNISFAETNDRNRFSDQSLLLSYLHWSLYNQIILCSGWRFCVYFTSFIISGFSIYGAEVVPDSGVGNTWQCLTLVLHEFLSNGLTPSRLHIVISFLTHADHVFLGLPRFLVPGSPKRVMELLHDVARCTCPYHLRRRVRYGFV